VSRRADGLVRQIERRAERDAILAPTYLHLKYQAVPLAKAVADLAAKTGYPLVLKDDAGKLASRTVSLDTGPSTFWQALDQFCQAAGLVELGVSNPRPPLGRPAPQIARGIAFPAP